MLAVVGWVFIPHDSCTACMISEIDKRSIRLSISDDIYPAYVCKYCVHNTVRSQNK